MPVWHARGLTYVHLTSAMRSLPTLLSSPTPWVPNNHRSMVRNPLRTTNQVPIVHIFIKPSDITRRMLTKGIWISKQDSLLPLPRYCRYIPRHSCTKTAIKLPSQFSEKKTFKSIFFSQVETKFGSVWKKVLEKSMHNQKEITKFVGYCSGSFFLCA